MLTPLNYSTQNTWETKTIIIFLAPLMTEIEMVSISGQATLTNKVNSARDRANFDFIELVYRKNVGNKLL